MPYHRRVVEDGVSGRTGDLSQTALGATETETETEMETNQEHRDGLTTG